MRFVIPALALLTAAGPAAAQPAPTPPPTPPPAEPTPFAEPTDPAAPPTTTPPPPADTDAPPARPPTAAAASGPAPLPTPSPTPSASDARRPDGFSLGIGLGYALPTSLQTPNITSLRLRLASGTTFEPRLSLAKSTLTVDTGPSTSSSASELGIGALVRHPLVRRGRVDLELLGGANIFQQSSAPPDVDDQDLAITTLTVSYGFAVGAWITPHWQVSLSALNPIITSVRRDEEMGPGTSTVTTNNTYGVIFDPDVLLMVHLYH